MRIRPILLAIVALLAVGAPVAAAQAQPGRAGAVRGEARGEPRTQAERDSLELRVRQRMGLFLKTQLRLTDEQMRRLQATNQRFEGRRRELLQSEREVRLELRAAMRRAETARGTQAEAPRDPARDAEISRLLDRMIGVQRQRVDLLEEEQRELATFLTPEQRARYYGIEEQIRRRVTEMQDSDRRRSGGPDSGRGTMRRPGGRPPGLPE